MSSEGEDNRVWILFANGEASQVRLSLHPAKPERNRPADAYVVTGGGLARSARRAAEAVYNWLGERGHNPDQFVAGFDVQDSDPSMNGESAGLAFALALAGRLLNRTGMSVAATGEIAVSTYPGPLARVEGVNDKLRAVARHLPAESVCCCPAANAGDIDGSTRLLLQQQGIALLLVDSVADALDHLFAGAGEEPQEGQSHRPGLRTKHLALVVAIVACLALGINWLLGDRPEQVVVAEEAMPVEQHPAPPTKDGDIKNFEQLAAPVPAAEEPAAPVIGEGAGNDRGFD